jgi:hypothetical protein
MGLGLTAFAGKAVRKAVSTLADRRYHESHRTWDLCIDGDGAVRVLEWNGGHNDITFSEATQGPCFADLDRETLWRR